MKKRYKIKIWCQFCLLQKSGWKFHYWSTALVKLGEQAYIYSGWYKENRTLCQIRFTLLYLNFIQSAGNLLGLKKGGFQLSIGSEKPFSGPSVTQGLKYPIVFGPFLQYILFIWSTINPMNFLIGQRTSVDNLEPV